MRRLSWLSLISVLSLTVFAEEDGIPYVQTERIVTWPSREELERWPRDEAQCDGETSSILSRLEHMCSLHLRCDAVSPPLDYWVACMVRRGHDVRRLVSD